MRRLTDLVPTPRPVTLAGGEYRISPATLRELATLQSVLDDDWPDPLDAVWPLLLDADDETRRSLLIQARVGWDTGPPLWDEESGANALATFKGVVAFLLIALRRHHGKLTVEDVVRIASGLSAAELAKARRVFFGIDSQREIDRLQLQPPDQDGERAGWGLVVDEVARDYGWTYGQVYDLTLAELGNARRAGKPQPDVVWPTKPGQTTTEAWRELCMAAYGKTPEELYGPPTPQPQPLPPIMEHIVPKPLPDGANTDELITVDPAGPAT